MTELAKFMIIAVMAVVTFTALALSTQLWKLTAPINRKLSRLHQSELGPDDLGERLQRVKSRYIALLTHVDNVDTAEFSAGEIETITFKLFSRELTAAAAQSWLRQAPGILISLGLLGTFAGLTVGLSQISGALGEGATPAETMATLSGIVAPMGAAFQTSLLGLFLSLAVLIWTQIAGTRDCLDRCESLLSSWLETVLPQQLGDKIMTPLRQSIQNLNTSVNELPDCVYTSVQSGMQEAFASKLNEIFNVNAVLATEAQSATRQLLAVANALNESGQDFVEAAHAFRQSNFATTLQESVNSLVHTNTSLTENTDSLCTRLSDLRDSLFSTQAEWKLLASAAEQELTSCRTATAQIQQEAATLNLAVGSLEQVTQCAIDSTKQLKEARLEVMRDRKLAIEVAESVRSRLATDNSVVESCQVFAAALESALTHWNQNVERLDNLSASYVDSVMNAKLQDEAILSERSKAVQEILQQIQTQLQNDMAAAIAQQRTAFADLETPARTAQDMSLNLLRQLDELQARLSSMSTQLVATAPRVSGDS